MTCIGAFTKWKQQDKQLDGFFFVLEGTLFNTSFLFRKHKHNAPKTWGGVPYFESNPRACAGAGS